MAKSSRSFFSNPGNNTPNDSNYQVNQKKTSFKPKFATQRDTSKHQSVSTSQISTTTTQAVNTSTTTTTTSAPIHTTSTTTTTTTLANQYIFHNASDQLISVVYLGGTTGNPDSTTSLLPNNTKSFVLTTDTIDFLCTFEELYTLTTGSYNGPPLDILVGQSFIGTPLSLELVEQLIATYGSNFLSIGNPIATTTTSTTTTTTTSVANNTSTTSTTTTQQSTTTSTTTTTTTVAPLIQLSILNNTNMIFSYSYGLEYQPQGIVVTPPSDTGTINPGGSYVTVYDSVNAIYGMIIIQAGSDPTDIYINSNLIYQQTNLQSFNGFTIGGVGTVVEFTTSGTPSVYKGINTLFMTFGV